MARAVTIHHMNVPIDDIDAACDFYGRVIGKAMLGVRDDTLLARHAG